MGGWLYCCWQVAANQRGIVLIGELIEQYGLEVVQAYMVHVQVHSWLPHACDFVTTASGLNPKPSRHPFTKDWVKIGNIWFCLDVIVLRTRVDTSAQLFVVTADLSWVLCLGRPKMMGGVNLGIWILLLPSVLKFSQSRKKKLAEWQGCAPVDSLS